MGFFDEEVNNSFDAMFDEDRDGILDPSEQAYRSTYLDYESEDKEPWDDSDNSSSFGNYSTGYICSNTHGKKNNTHEMSNGTAICLTVLILIISALFIIPFGGEKCPNFLKVIILIITGIGVMAVYDKLTK